MGTVANVPSTVLACGVGLAINNMHCIVLIWWTKIPLSITIAANMTTTATATMTTTDFTAAAANATMTDIASIATVTKIYGRSITGRPITSDMLTIKIIWALIHKMGISTIITFESSGRRVHLVSVVRQQRHPLSQQQLLPVLCERGVYHLHNMIHQRTLQLHV